jgi:hypothetical protein
VVAYLGLVACVGYPENPQGRSTLHIVTYPPKRPRKLHRGMRGPASPTELRLEPSKPRRFTEAASAPESIGDYAARREFLP